MNKDQIDAIIDCRDHLEKSMPTDHMKTQLLVGQIISLDDEDEIDAKATHRKKNAALLKLVLRSQDSNSYDVFVRALRSIPTKSNVLADMVESCYKKRRAAVPNKTDSAAARDDQLDSATDKHSEADVFISYCWDDQDDVLRIKEYLEAQNLKVWLDLDKVKGGNLLNKVLSEGVQRCKIFIPCISASYIKSTNCYAEISSARDYKKNSIPLILGNLEPSKGDLKSHLGDFNFFITGKKYIKIKDFKNQDDVNKKLDELKDSVFHFLEKY